MTQPMNPVDYVASKQVGEIIQLVIETRYRKSSSWLGANEKRFQDGIRYGVAMALRELVALETSITDPEDLDGLCSDLIDGVLENAS